MKPLMFYSCSHEHIEDVAYALVKDSGFFGYPFQNIAPLLPADCGFEKWAIKAGRNYDIWINDDRRGWWCGIELSTEDVVKADETILEICVDYERFYEVSLTHALHGIPPKVGSPYRLGHFWAKDECSDLLGWQAHGAPRKMCGFRLFPPRVAKNVCFSVNHDLSHFRLLGLSAKKDN